MVHRVRSKRRSVSAGETTDRSLPHRRSLGFAQSLHRSTSRDEPPNAGHSRPRMRPIRSFAEHVPPTQNRPLSFGPAEKRQAQSVRQICPAPCHVATSSPSPTAFPNYASSSGKACSPACSQARGDRRRSAPPTRPPHSRNRALRFHRRPAIALDRNPARSRHDKVPGRPEVQAGRPAQMPATAHRTTAVKAVSRCVMRVSSVVWSRRKSAGTQKRLRPWQVGRASKVCRITSRP